MGNMSQFVAMFSAGNTEHRHSKSRDGRPLEFGAASWPPIGSSRSVGEVWPELRGGGGEEQEMEDEEKENSRRENKMQLATSQEEPPEGSGGEKRRRKGPGGSRADSLVEAKGRRALARRRRRPEVEKLIGPKEWAEVEGENSFIWGKMRARSCAFSSHSGSQPLGLGQDSSNSSTNSLKMAAELASRQKQWSLIGAQLRQISDEFETRLARNQEGSLARRSNCAQLELSSGNRPELSSSRDALEVAPNRKWASAAPEETGRRLSEWIKLLVIVCIIRAKLGQR